MFPACCHLRPKTLADFPGSLCARLSTLSAHSRAVVSLALAAPPSLQVSQRWELRASQFFQYLGHLMWASDSLEKTVMLGKIEGRRRRGRQRMRWLNGMVMPMPNSTDLSLSNLWEIVKEVNSEGNSEAWCAAVHGVTKSQTWLNSNSKGVRTAPGASSFPGTRQSSSKPLWTAHSPAFPLKLFG